MLECRILNGDNDAHQLLAFLRQHVSTSMFMLNNFSKRGFENKGRSFDATYYGAFEAGVLKGVIAHNWNGLLALQTPHKLAQEALFNFVRTHQNNAFKGVVGEGAEVRAFNKFMEWETKDFSFFSEEKLMKLPFYAMKMPRNLRELERSFFIEKASMKDLEILVEWRKNYETEVLNMQDHPDLLKVVEERVMRDIESGYYFVLRHQNKLCAYGGLNAFFGPFAQLGGIFTPKNHRNKGYAQVLIYLFLRKLWREAGFHMCFLFTHHPAAFKVYQNLGFKESGTYTLGFLKEDKA